MVVAYGIDTGEGLEEAWVDYVPRSSPMSNACLFFSGVELVTVQDQLQKPQVHTKPNRFACPAA